MRARGTAACSRRIVCLCAFLLSGAGSGAADTSRGAQLAATCASCHMLDGRGAGIPVIAGMDEQAIIAAMQGYRASETESHVMHAVARSLSAEELAAVARHLAAHGADGQ